MAVYLEIDSNNVMYKKLITYSVHDIGYCMLHIKYFAIVFAIVLHMRKIRFVICSMNNYL